jgi:hypothetical protein
LDCEFCADDGGYSGLGGGFGKADDAAEFVAVCEGERMMAEGVGAFDKGLGVGGPIEEREG